MACVKTLEVVTLKFTISLGNGPCCLGVWGGARLVHRSHTKHSVDTADEIRLV